MRVPILAGLTALVLGVPGLASEPTHREIDQAVAFLAQGELDRAREHLARAEELGLHVNPKLKEELKLPADE